MRTSAFIIALGFLFASSGWSAQEGKEIGLIEVTVGFGATSNGPAKKLADHMIANGFGKTRTDWWWNLSHAHPHYQTSGGNIHLTVTYKYDEKSRVGLLFSKSNFGEVGGYAIENRTGLDIDIALNSRAVIPYYSIQLDVFQFKAGLGLMTNKRTQYLYKEENPAYSTSKLAYMAGMDVYIFDRPRFILLLNSYYIYSSPSSIGPFNAEGGGMIKQLPRTEIGFGHMVFALSMGIRVGSKQN